MRRCSQIVVVVLSLLPAASAAQDRVLVVRADRGAQPIAERLARRLVDAWRAEGNQVRRPRVAEEEEPAAPPLEAARRAYHEMRPADAARRLEEWLGRVDEGARLPDTGAYVEGLVWLALARLALEDTAGADAALGRALAASPALALAEEDYPPTVRDRLAARRAQAGLAELRLSSDPAGAEVRVDGAVRGTTPLTLELGVGRHLLRITEPRHAPAFEALTLGPEGGELSRRLEPDPARHLSVAREVDAATLAAARRLGGALAWLVVECEGGDCRARLDDRGGGRVSAAGPSASAAELARALLLTPVEPPPPPVEPGGEDPWPWVGLGVGAALVAIAAVVVGVLIGGQSDGWTGTILRVGSP